VSEVAREQKYDPEPLEIFRGETPAAGADFTLTSPGRPGYLLIAVTFRLVTDANAANRAVTVDYADENAPLMASNGVGFVVTANTTELFAFQANIGQAAWNTAGQAFAPLLPAEFQGGQKLQINVLNIQAGDQLDRIVMTFKRRSYAPS
jgi:hypothetical protein